jgi:N4-(beta-N-acetylglucosaminyl)-L-asparaginase
MKGRVGDSPLIGCGLYADNEAGAAAATGRGEEIARVCGSFLIVELMRQGWSPQDACEETVSRLLKRVPTSIGHQMAFIAINPDGAFGAAAARDPFPFAAANSSGNRLLAGTCRPNDSGKD